MGIEWPNNALQRFGVVGGSRRRIGASQGLAVNRACGPKRVNCPGGSALLLESTRVMFAVKPPIMKPHLILAFAIATLSLTQAFSQGPAQPPMISVSGSAEVKVAPDEIYLRVGVETRHDNLEDAKKQNDERVWPQGLVSDFPFVYFVWLAVTFRARWHRRLLLCFRRELDQRFLSDERWIAEAEKESLCWHRSS